METRPIPRTGEALPVIGVGTWRSFDVGRGERARAPLRDVLRSMMRGGGTIVDSSPMYGRAEGVAGDLIEELAVRDSLFMATKVWTDGREDGIAQMTESMRLLRTGRIDLMQIHNLVDWRTQLRTLREWKESGKIRYLGITHYTPSAFSQLADIIEAEDIDFVQLPYSIAVRNAEARLLPLAAEKGVAVMVNRPFEGGRLFSTVRGSPLPGWAEEEGITCWAGFFLRFILSHPAVTCVIPATSVPERMAEFTEADDTRNYRPETVKKYMDTWNKM